MFAADHTPYARAPAAETHQESSRRRVSRSSSVIFNRCRSRQSQWNGSGLSPNMWYMPRKISAPTGRSLNAQRGSNEVCSCQGSASLTLP